MQARRPTLKTKQFCTVRLYPPMRPGSFLPLNTFPGSWHCPMDPGRRCASEAPCDAGWPLNPNRFITPCESDGKQLIHYRSRQCHLAAAIGSHLALEEPAHNP